MNKEDAQIFKEDIVLTISIPGRESHKEKVTQHDNDDLVSLFLLLFSVVLQKG